jgi:chromate transporter
MASQQTHFKHGVSWNEAFRVWLRIAALSFGGPAGQIAVMHRILVEEKRWISESRFLHALNYCMLLPGPEAQQLATYVGWLMHRTLGGLMAGGLFILPGVVAIMALSYVYAAYGQVGIVAALFFGLKAAVLAIVVEAVVRVGARAEEQRDARAGGRGLLRHFFPRRALPHHCVRCRAAWIYRWLARLERIPGG